MIPELLRNLLALTLVCSTSIVIVLSMRHVVRRAFGASVGYAAWLLVPISMLALFMPGARDTGYELVIQAQVSPVSSLGRAACCAMEILSAILRRGRRWDVPDAGSHDRRP